MEIKESFEDYGIHIPYRRTSGNVKTTCPKCKTSGRGHPNDRSLSANIDQGLWKCHYCGFSGALKGYERKPYTPRRHYTTPPPLHDNPLPQKTLNWFATQRGISGNTLRQLGIKDGKEFMPQVGRELYTVQFPYYHDGKLVNVKYRTIHKDKELNKQFKMVQGAELIPYNIDSIADTPTAVIVEGEMDVLACVEAGVKNVISVPSGANGNLAWLDDFMEGYFDDKEAVIIAVDNDEPGQQLQQALVTRLGAERCRIATWGDGCKDANEQLMRYGKDSLKARIKNAKDVKIGGIFSLDDYEPNLDRLYENGLQKGLTIGHPAFDELISVETKRLMVVTGIPSSGKSEFIDEMVIRLNLRYGFKCAFFSPENMPFELHAAKLIEKLCGRRLKHEPGGLTPDQYANAKQHLRDNFFHILPEQASTLEAILEKARTLVRRHGIKILVIDPYNRIEATFEGSETNYISKVLDQLSDFAQRNDALVILMAHPRKINSKDNADGIPTFYDINGSANFFNKTDFGLIVHRNRDDDYTLVRVAKVKFRHLGHNGDAYFKFNINNGRYVPWDKDNPQPVTFDNSDYLATGLPTTTAPGNNLDFITTQGDDVPF